MSSFNCEKCGTAILDTPGGSYVTECEHYPKAIKKQNHMDKLKKEADEELSKFYGAMFECGDFDALNKLFHSYIDKAHLDGKEEGLNSKQDYADRAYEKGKQEEQERLLNQQANQHDQEVRRKRNEEIIEWAYNAYEIDEFSLKDLINFIKK